MDAADIAAAIRAVGFVPDGSPRRGGTATVYPGRAIADGKPVAIKVFNAEIEPARFEREASILASINHQSIASLIDYGHLGSGNPYLVTEWIEGETLAERLERAGPLDVAAVRRVLISLCDALEHVHRQGIVHRDLSLANVLIDSDNRPTLIDFGIARADDLHTITATTELMGTTRYLAPELLEGAAPTPSSDQYATAILAYELLAGVWPFDESTSVGQAFHHHLSSEPIPISEKVEDVPAPMASAIARSLSKKPEDRFSSIQGLADAALSTQPVPVSASGGKRVFTALVAAGALTAAIFIGARLVSGGEAGGDEPESAAASPTTTGVPDPTVTERSSPTTTWPAGLAGELECNLLTTPGFEGNSLPNNFWNDPTDVERATLEPGAGIDGSNAVAIGRDGEFGAFGSVVDVRPNADYVFVASVEFTERPFVAEMSVVWLTSAFEPINQEPIVVDLLPAAPGRAVLEIPSAPAEAAFAVTRLYKDDSGGVLIADELVFAERDPACDSLLGVGS